MGVCDLGSAGAEERILSPEGTYVIYSRAVTRLRMSETGQEFEAGLRWLKICWCFEHLQLVVSIWGTRPAGSPSGEPDLQCLLNNVFEQKQTNTHK